MKHTLFIEIIIRDITRYAKEDKEIDYDEFIKFFCSSKIYEKIQYSGYRSTLLF